MKTEKTISIVRYDAKICTQFSVDTQTHTHTYLKIKHLDLVAMILLNILFNCIADCCLCSVCCIQGSFSNEFVRFIK